MLKKPLVHVVGGGLAGSEACYQLLLSGCSVKLYEMRPVKLSAAHKTGGLAELVCSNSLKSMDKNSAPGLLKEEMQAFDSLIIKAAYQAQVPAGMALAVDREVLSGFVEETLNAHPDFERIADEIVAIPSEEELKALGEFWVLATGPLTSQALSEAIKAYDERGLYFYDAIAPVLAADSIDRNICFTADRYGKGEGEGDYLNVPLSKAEYESFIQDVIAAEKMPLHDFEEARYFESCLPIEVMVDRGPETLRFGPMKPVGITDPRTGRWSYANLQLRMENKEATMYSMVGFQTKMKWPEQKRVFSKLPGLQDVEILRYGSVHRNTYVDSPRVLARDFSLRKNSRVFLAGQITGVEGYTESAAIGLLVGRVVGAKARGQGEFELPPMGTILGGLANYVLDGPKGPFAPMNTHLGLLPPVERKRGMSKADKKGIQCETARECFKSYLLRTKLQAQSNG